MKSGSVLFGFTTFTGVVFFMLCKKCITNSIRSLAWKPIYPQSYCNIFHSINISPSPLTLLFTNVSLFPTIIPTLFQHLHDPSLLEIHTRTHSGTLVQQSSIIHSTWRSVTYTKSNLYPPPWFFNATLRHFSKPPLKDNQVQELLKKFSILKVKYLKYKSF